jgi:hypothetical protein
LKAELVFILLLFLNVLADFRHGAPNYGKTPYPENPKSQTFQIKDLIPVLS